MSAFRHAVGSPVLKPLNATCPQALADSLDRAVRKDDAYLNKLIRIMTTRCMTQVPQAPDDSSPQGPAGARLLIRLAA